jgi:tRNA(Ile)-lysidine synthase
MRPFSPEHLIAALAPYPGAPRVWVAFSGGLDSTCLLSATAAAAGRLPGALHAVHLDHGLHPDSARWAEHCLDVCEALGVPLKIDQLSIRRAPGESLEAVAREARYAALAALLGPGDLVLTAQHQDDQAETLLLALLRGSGIEGLAAMGPVSRLGPGWLLRPLLDVPRAALEAYAREEALPWIEDPSNASLAFDRNFLRRRALPLLRRRWPSASATLARSATHCAEAADLIEAQAAEALAGLGGTRPGALSIAGVAGLDPALARAAVRLWLRRRGLPLPDSAHLRRILTEVLPARSDVSPLVAWPGCEIRRFRGDLMALEPLPPPPTDLSLSWDGGVLVLPQPLGTLRRVPTGQGSEGVRGGDGAPRLRVRFGIPGQRCRTRPQGHRRALKKLFQEAAIPPWLRPYVPLVFAGDRLVAVAGVCACAGEPNADHQGCGVRWEGHPWEGLGCFSAPG